MSKSNYDKSFLLDMYACMHRIRKFEMKAADSFMKGLCAGNIHLCIGQEAVPTGVTRAMTARDYFTSTHRGHGHAIARGLRADKSLAELFGKATGYCKGKGGSMHIADMELGHLGANGIVSAGLPIATGSGLASKILGTDEVTVCFFGDSASNRGPFHESLNMAAAWKLPVVYLCENNQYGVSVNIHTVTNTDTIAVRAQAYNIPGKTVDGNDVLAVYEAAKEAIDYTRAGNGPYLLECMTFRHQGHYCGDPASYRPKSYLEEAKEKDAIDRYHKYLLDSSLATEAELEAINQEVDNEIEEAFVFSQNSPYPDLSTVTEDMYKADNERSVAR